MTTQDQFTLETMIDQHGLTAILDCLSGICGLKAEHIQHNWQDSNTANEWENAANILDAATSKVMDLKL